jgi:hypothetical protein
MAATSSNEGILAPTLVGAGSGNAAKGSGMAGGKRNASLSPPKPRTSSNLGRCCRTLRPESPSESDITAGDTRARSGSNKTRSAASALEQSTKALKSLVSPAGQGARSKTARLGRQVEASLPTHRTELADTLDASKGATRAPKPMGSPAGRLVRSKTTHLGADGPSRRSKQGPRQGTGGRVSIGVGGVQR